VPEGVDHPRPEKSGFRLVLLSRRFDLGIGFPEGAGRVRFILEARWEFAEAVPKLTARESSTSGVVTQAGQNDVLELPSCCAKIQRFGLGYVNGLIITGCEGNAVPRQRAFWTVNDPCRVRIVLQCDTGVLGLQLSNCQIGYGNDGHALGLHLVGARVGRNRLKSDTLYLRRHRIEDNRLRCQLLLSLLPERL